MPQKFFLNDFLMEIFEIPKCKRVFCLLFMINFIYKILMELKMDQL